MGVRRTDNITVRLAFRTWQKRSEIDGLNARIQAARSNLLLSLLVYGEARMDHHQMVQSNEHKALITEIREKNCLTNTMKSDIRNLSSTLADMRLDDSNAKAQIQVVVQRLETHRLQWNKQSKRVLEYVRNSSPSTKSWEDKVQRLAELLDREISCRSSILQSLSFYQMNRRRNAVSRAHQQTFQWIFKYNDEHVAVWHNFLYWLTQGKTVMYWVSGKPGSGKTTLMRELDEQLRNQAVLKTWLGQSELLQASCYFWSSGTRDEKSLDGMLRSLLYQLLKERPDLIEQTTYNGSEHFITDVIKGMQRVSWEISELKKALLAFVYLTTHDSKLLLLIDGLDEYEGTDEDREAMISFLGELSLSGHVRICVASRPWVIFRDAFDQSPQLRVEDLTCEDIKLYVYENFHDNSLFKKLMVNNDLLAKIAKEIIAKAQGVFLWVRLVVRDLIKVLRDGGRSMDLFRKLHSIPSDLNAYFGMMMESIDPAYRKDAYMILQTAISSEMVSDNEANKMLLVHVYYLDEDLGKYFALDPKFEEANYLDDSEFRYTFDRIDRRLTSRCMGLMELDRFTHGSSLRTFEIMNAIHQDSDLACVTGWSTRVGFLHRTARDFLSGPVAQEILQNYAVPGFDAKIYRCNVLVAHMKSLSRTPGFEGRIFLAAADLLSVLRTTPLGQFESLDAKAAQEFLGQVVSMIHHIEPFLTRRNIDRIRGDAHSVGAKVLLDLAEAWTKEEISEFGLAIQIGWRSLIECRLTRKQNVTHLGRPLLDHALCGALTFEIGESYSIVNSLLNLGSSPRQKCNGLPLWRRFVIFLKTIKSRGGYMKDADGPRRVSEKLIEVLIQEEAQDHRTGEDDASQFLKLLNTVLDARDMAKVVQYFDDVSDGIQARKTSRKRCAVDDLIFQAEPLRAIELKGPHCTTDEDSKQQPVSKRLKEDATRGNVKAHP